MKKKEELTKENSLTGLEEHLRVEALISDLLARFLNIPDALIDSEIEDAIRRIVEFLGLDQGLVVQWREDGTRPLPTHSWTVMGGLPVPVSPGNEVVPWVHRQSVLGKIVVFSRLDELPQEAEVDKEFFRRSGRKALISLPLRVGGKVVGALVFASLQAETIWSDEVVRRLQLIAEVFAGVLDRKKKKAELEERLRFEKLISDLSAAFVTIPSDEIDEEIKKCLQRLTEFFDVDRCTFGEFSAEADKLVITYSYTRQGISPAPDYISAEQVPHFIGQLKQGIPFVINEQRELPPEWESERRYMLEKDIKSVMAYPVISGGRALGMCTLISLRLQKRWENELVQRFRLVSEVFAGALARRRMEGKLQAAADEWHKTFNTIKDLIMIMDREFRIVQVNDATVSFFGLPREKIIGLPCYRLMHGTEKPMEGCPYGKMLGTKAHEEANVYDEGRAMWFHIVVDPLLDEKGEVIGVVHTVRDITDRKLAEASRLESMERFRAIVEAFDGFTYICSPDYRVEFMNQSLIERTGRYPIGEPCYKALHDRDSICPWCVNERVFRGETVRWELQSPKDHRWYYIVNTPIRHPDGTISKQSMIQDITERKEAEEALKKSETALRNNQKDLRMLAGRLISVQEEELRRLSRELHDDLTQRLAVLAIEAGKLELQLKKVPRSFSVPSLKIEQIKAELIKVSEDVHHISRQLHPSILDDLGIARAIESECAALLKREDIQITFVKENIGPNIPNDIALCLYRIIQESLRNITSHSRSKMAEIVLKETDGCIWLTIKDSGIGFDPLKARHKPGLGLASMRERVQLIQGDFSIESQPGKGAEINVRVPLTRSGV